MSNVPSNQQIQIQSNPMLPSSFLCLRQDPCNSSGVTFRQVSDETQCALEERVPTAAIFESRQQRRRGSQQRWWRRCKRRERRSSASPLLSIVAMLLAAHQNTLLVLPHLHGRSDGFAKVDLLKKWVTSPVTNRSRSSQIQCFLLPFSVSDKIHVTPPVSLFVKSPMKPNVR